MKMTPDSPNIDNGLIQIITMGKSICHQWVNTFQSSQQASSQEQKDKPTSGGKTPKKQVLAGGTIMEEMKVGDGQVAKKGKMVN